MRISDWSSDVCSSYLATSSASAEESLAIALGKAPLPEPGPLLGEYRAGSLIRNARTSAALKATRAATGAWQKARNEGVLDDEEEAQESKVLKAFSSLASGGGPLGDLFKKLLGMGSQAGRSEEHTSELQSRMGI